MSDPLGSVLGSAKAGPDKVQLGLRLFKRAEALKEKRRTVFDPIVQEIYDYFMPDLSDINTGLLKATTFGLLIGLSGCLRGLQSDRNASGVGHAATSAVVTAILLIIVADAMFAVLFNAIGL